MITEIILAVNFQMRCSQMAIDRIEEDDSPGFKVLRYFISFTLSLSFTLKVHALILNIVPDI